MLTLDTLASLPLLIRTENGLPRRFLVPGTPITLIQQGQPSVHLLDTGDVEFFGRNEPVDGARPFSRRALIQPGPDPHPLEYALWLMDRPQHQRTRDAAKGPFLARHISQQESLIYRSALRQIEKIRRNGSSFSLTTDFGQPFALNVISSILGAAEEVPDFFRHLARVAELEQLNAYPPENGLVAILDGIIDDHLARPKSHGAFGDLLEVFRRDELAPAKDEARHILRGYLASLLFAGTDTVAMTLGNVFLGLRRWGMWDVAIWAAKHDDRALLEALIQEAFRLDVPFPTNAARVVVPVRTPSGTLLTEGTMVVSWLSAANRGSRFTNPNRFVLGRTEPHLGYGPGGYHYCLGAPLANLELVIATQLLLTELPGLHISGKPTYTWPARVKRLRLPCDFIREKLPRTVACDRPGFRSCARARYRRFGPFPWSCRRALSRRPADRPRTGGVICRQARNSAATWENLADFAMFATLYGLDRKAILKAVLWPDYPEPVMGRPRGGPAGRCIAATAPTGCRFQAPPRSELSRAECRSSWSSPACWACLRGAAAA